MRCALILGVLAALVVPAHAEDVAIYETDGDAETSGADPRVAALDEAFGKAINLALVEQGPAMAFVPRLRTPLAPAGAALCPIAQPWTVGRRRLGGVVGIEGDPLFQDQQARLQFAEQQRLGLDDGVAFGQRLR